MFQRWEYGWSNGNYVLRFLVVLILLFGICLLAVALVSLYWRIRRNRARREWVGLELGWDTYLMDVLAGKSSTADARRVVVKSRHIPWFLDHLAGYATILRGAKNEVVNALAQPFLGWAKVRLSHRDPSARAHAAHLVGVLGHPLDREQLLMLLDDPSPLVVMECARLFLQSPIPKEREEVILRLERFVDWNRFTLAALLSTYGGLSLAPSLRALLTDTRREAWVRMVAADALIKILDPKAAWVASLVCREGNSPALFAAGLRLLGRTGSAMDLPLIRAALTDPHALVRAAALDALSFLGAYEDLPLFTASLGDSSPWVVLHGVQALKRQGRLGLLKDIASSTHPSQPFVQKLLQDAILR